MFCTFGSKTEAGVGGKGPGARGSRGLAGARAGFLLSVCRAVRAVPESLRPGRAPAPSQATSASLGVGRGAAAWPPAEPTAEKERLELLPLPRPTGCQQVCPQDPDVRATPSHPSCYPVRPSRHPASPQDLRRPQPPQGPARFPQLSPGPAPDAEVWHSAPSARPSRSWGGERAPPQRRREGM